MNAIANLADERLLIEAAQHDPSRFAELYESNFHRVYAFVVRRVHDRTEAEDLTAEVFHQALSNIGRFEWRGVPFAAWLLRIAANTLADRWQRVSRNQELQADVLEDTEAETEEDVERRVILFQLVERLPADQRLVIVRRFIDQRSVREIAHELGRTEGAVKQLQFRGLQGLRDKARSQS
ncbi:MAG TPA: sigma-70 family RNA polymerase sigma factor [Candidatus Angelobacter sp.]|nr:sigma-70 family RNA polymerase sigma factor [Candidatus Angelobacter sp.]